MGRCARIAIIVGTAVVAANLISIIHHYQLRAGVNAYIAELKARGELLDLAQVIPPPVPPEQNDAPSFLNAASTMDTNWEVFVINPPPAMRMVAPGKAMIGWEQPDIRRGGRTNSWQDIGAALAKENDPLNSLQQITSRPDLDFNLDYAGGFTNFEDPLFVHLASLKPSAQGLSASAIYELHRGDAASAVKATHAMLLLARAIEHDRLILSEMVGMAVAQMGSAATWEILQFTNVTDGQLAELQRDWTNVDFVRSEERTLLTDEAMEQVTLGQWRNSGLQSYVDLEANAANAGSSMSGHRREKGLWRQAQLKARIFMWRYWWSYPDELRSLKGYDASINAVRSAETNAAFLDALKIEDQKFDELGILKIEDGVIASISDINLHTLLSQSVAGVDTFTRKVMLAEAAQRVTLTAIALKRYQLKNGKYPMNLDSLVPEFLPAVAVDPVNGRPLHYRLTADGTFLLYSVGENGRDDGGNPSVERNAESPEFSSKFNWENLPALDWVWPQPATPQEVQNYYANLGK